MHTSKDLAESIVRTGFCKAVLSSLVHAHPVRKVVIGPLRQRIKPKRQSRVQTSGDEQHASDDLSAENAWANSEWRSAFKVEIFEKKRCYTRVVDVGEIDSIFDEFLPLFKQVDLFFTDGQCHIRTNADPWESSWSARVLSPDNSFHSSMSEPREMAGDREYNGEGHNRIKNYPFPEGVPHPFLVALGVMDRQGAVVAAMRRKFVQINMLLSSIHDLLEFVQTQPGPFRVVDAGCGKGYLTFALASMLGDRAEVIGIDSRDDVIATCRSVCERLAIKNLTFELGTIGSVDASLAPDVLISLHACNTATDVALFKAIQMKARAIAVAPCCQHELAPLIPKSLCSIVFGHPIMAQKAAALLTDAFRCELLSACGYDVKAIEFVDPEQTPKNILIKALRTGVSRPLHEDFLKIRRQLSSGMTLERLLVASHYLDVT